jgi:hypothetical protein
MPLPAGVVSRYVGRTRESFTAGKGKNDGEENGRSRMPFDMTRTDAIARAHQHLHSGEFLRELDRRVAYPTESQNPERRDALRAYLEDELKPAFSQLDFSTRIVESPTGKNPYLLAEYRESTSAPTVLMYGHGDVVDGMAGEWRDNLDPWRTTISGNRVYGRGTADNRRAAAGSASMPNSSLRPARRSARRICARSASSCAMSWLPICFWRPTGPGFPLIVPPYSSAAAVESGSTSM